MSFYLAVSGFRDNQKTSATLNSRSNRLGQGIPCTREAVQALKHAQAPGTLTIGSNGDVSTHAQASSTSLCAKLPVTPNYQWTSCVPSIKTRLASKRGNCYLSLVQTPIYAISGSSIPHYAAGDYCALTGKVYTQETYRYVWRGDSIDHSLHLSLNGPAFAKRATKTAHKPLLIKSAL